jgi:hypothetical protein
MGILANAAVGMARRHPQASVRDLPHLRDLFGWMRKSSIRWRTWAKKVRTSQLTPKHSLKPSNNGTPSLNG